MNNSPTPYNRHHPFMAKIKDRYPLCKAGSKKYTHHVILDTTHSGMTYNVGDSVAIYPSYDANLVQLTINAMHATGDETITDKHSGNTFSLREFLTKKASITDFSRKLVSEIAARQTNTRKKEHLEFILQEANKDAFKEYQSSHELWDLLKENEEVRFGIEELCLFLMPIAPRFYSIASSGLAVGNEIHLTVSYVRYVANGHMRLGVCSHYLCDMSPLHEASVPIYINPHHGFTLPESPDSNLIMIGPGTGIAPYRAFMQERMAKNDPGKNWLFFGEWNRATDYFYEDFWEGLVREGKIRVDLAFSRDQEHKVYVQHRMLERAKELYSWLEEGAYLYVCGDAHRMAKDVDATLHQIVQEQGNKSEQEAREYVKALRTKKRYLRDVY